MHHHAAMTQFDYAAILATALVLGALFIMLRESGKPSDFGRKPDPTFPQPQRWFHNSALYRNQNKWTLLWLALAVLLIAGAHKLGLL